MLNRISIKDGICIDGVEVKALKEVNINSDIDNISEVTIKFLAKVEGLDTVDKSPTYEKKKVVVDVNFGEYVFEDLYAFRVVKDSSVKEATKVENASLDDYLNLEDKWCEFWFDNGTKYTRMDVTTIYADECEIRILCIEESDFYFLDEGNNQVFF